MCRHCGKDIKDYGGHRKYLNPAGLNLTDFWDDTSPARHQKNKSRWRINELKPVIPERCIQISTNPGEIVLDPFGGGGSTYVTAERLCRSWIGTEIGPCEPILDRFAREFPVLVKPSTIPENLRSFFEQPCSRRTFGRDEFRLPADAVAHAAIDWVARRRKLSSPPGV